MRSTKIYVVLGKFFQKIIINMKVQYIPVVINLASMYKYILWTQSSKSADVMM